MDKTSEALSVFFEDPFWVGVFERTADGKLCVYKATFGAEPTDAEVYLFILESYDRLRFSPAVRSAPKPELKTRNERNGRRRDKCGRSGSAQNRRSL